MVVRRIKLKTTKRMRISSHFPKTELPKSFAVIQTSSVFFSQNLEVSEMIGTFTQAEPVSKSTAACSGLPDHSATLGFGCAHL